MSAFLNLGSLIFGLLSWTVPLLIMKWKPGTKVWAGSIALSFGFGLIALLLQIFEIKNRVQVMDWSAIADTIDVMAWGATALVSVTVLLNIAVVFQGNSKKP